MKLNYLAPYAEIRFLLSKDIIAASGEGAQNPISPEQTPDMDYAVDPFT